MAERRYSFRFSLPEGCVLLLSLLLTSFLVFLFGVYVGKEVEAHKAARQTRTARLPTSVPGELPLTRPLSEPPATTSTVPAEKTEAPSTLINSSVPPAPHDPPSSPNTTVAMAQKKMPFAVLPNSEMSVPVAPQPQPDSPSPAAAAASVPPKSSLPSPSAPTAATAVSKPRPNSPSPPKAAASVPPKPSSLPSTSTTVAKSKPSSPVNSATAASSAMAVGSEFDSREKKSSTPSKRWAVQVQATTQEAAAQSVAKQLREQGLSPVVSKVERQGEMWYRVRVGKFANAGEAEAIVSRFRREGKFTQAYPVLE